MTFALLLVVGCQRSAANDPPIENDQVEGTAVDTSVDVSTDSGDTAGDTASDTAGDTAPDTAAPCTFTVPSTAQVIPNDTSIVDDHVVAWVCRNTTLSYGGTGGTFYLGARAALVLGRIGGNTVYAEGNASLHNFGTTNVLVVADPDDVLDEAEGGATVTTCPNLTLDLRDAPIPGCDAR